MALKRVLLEETVRQDPDPDSYEQWLLERCLESGEATGPMRSMALDVLSEWQLAQESVVFRRWLQHGAPSDDATPSTSPE